MTARPRPTAGGGKKWLSAGAGQGAGRLSFVFSQNLNRKKSISKKVEMNKIHLIGDRFHRRSLELRFPCSATFLRFVFPFSCLPCMFHFLAVVCCRIGGQLSCASSFKRSFVHHRCVS